MLRSMALFIVCFLHFLCHFLCHLHFPCISSAICPSYSTCPSSSAMLRFSMPLLALGLQQCRNGHSSEPAGGAAEMIFRREPVGICHHCARNCPLSKGISAKPGRTSQRQHGNRCDNAWQTQISRPKIKNTTAPKPTERMSRTDPKRGSCQFHWWGSPEQGDRTPGTLSMKTALQPVSECLG